MKVLIAYNLVLIPEGCLQKLNVYKQVEHANSIRNEIENIDAHKTQWSYLTEVNFRTSGLTAQQSLIKRKINNIILDKRRRISTPILAMES